MIAPPPGVHVWLACGHTDIRKGFEGFLALAQQQLGKDPFSGQLFVFRGKRGDLAKVLSWDGHGLWLYANVPDSPLRPRIAAGITALDARFADRILQPTDPTVRRWGAISGDVKRQTGQTPPLIDMRFAATAVEHDLWLVTRNLQHRDATPFKPWDRDPSSRR